LTGGLTICHKLYAEFYLFKKDGIMAPKRKDNPKFNGPMAVINQNFGRSTYDQSYLRSVWQGATTPIHFGGDAGYMIGVGVLAVAACGSLLHTAYKYDDVNISVIQTQHDNTLMNAFRYSGQRVL